MSKKKTKALVLIVEGSTDETLFSALLQDHFEAKGIKIFPYRTDIFVPQRTDDPNKDIREKIRDFVIRELERQQISQTHVLGIIHIGDTDGTFIPDNNIIVSSQASSTRKTQYSDTHIHVVDDGQMGNIRTRNRQKAENHRRMICIDKITISRKEIPYMHFFMSCDTDHLIFNLRNLSLKDKEVLMDEFTDKNDSDAIKTLLEKHMDICPNGLDPFRYTWDQIQLGVNSLVRKTNTPLLFSFIERLLLSDEQTTDAIQKV